jgi:hypothetical protein
MMQVSVVAVLAFLAAVPAVAPAAVEPLLPMDVGLSEALQKWRREWGVAGDEREEDDDG